MVSLSCGDAHVIALRSDGEVFLWGYNVSRQCGPETSDIRYPRRLSDFWLLPDSVGGVVQVAAGYVASPSLPSSPFPQSLHKLIFFLGIVKTICLRARGRYLGGDETGMENWEWVI